ncbi:hypothetical protein DM02DRAFT_676706 [Periconia macrospinosa]|uniref:Oxidase ustYa n=1 Tax=Periconia macrospinosa TaxID=97972 RepID=A0A2V1D7Z5_9PLEO|nr:hypothetical protein DM02DRAFT_676706 [Periconia macrospinosa]
MMSPTHAYKGLPTPTHTRTHSHRSTDSDSATEVESLMDPLEKDWDASNPYAHGPRAPRRGKRSVCVSILKASRWVVVITLQVVIVGLLAKEQGYLKYIPWFSGSEMAMGAGKPERSTSRAEVGGDITGWGPHIPTQITQFHINQTFAPYNTSEFFSNPNTMRAWNDLMPKGMGFQNITDPWNPAYRDFPTPIVWDEGQTVFTTSMTHQLHCLFAVVRVYSGLTSNHELPEDHHWHMIHCFDYMRQAILCSADMALEGLETTFPDHNGGSDGWDSKHVCRDPKVVRERLESVRAYDDQEIF